MSKVKTVIVHQVKDIYQYKNIKRNHWLALPMYISTKCLKNISSQNKQESKSRIQH